MKNEGFWKLLAAWFFVALAMLMLNSFTLQSAAVHSLTLATLGVVLLIWPMYPPKMEEFATPKQCALLMRIFAVVEIVASLLVRTSF